MKKFQLLLITLLLVTNSYGQFVENFDNIGVSGTGTWAPYTGAPTWAIINVTGPQKSWIITNATSNFPAHTGNVVAYMDRENVLTGDAEDWLITPQIDLTNIPNPELKFFSTSTIAGNNGTVYEIRVSTDANQLAQGNYVILQTYTETELSPNAGSHNELTVDLSQLPNNPAAVYIAFVMKGDYRDRWVLDDVKVTNKCEVPTPLAASDVISNSASLSWTNPSGATEWETEVVPNTSPFTGTGTIVSQNPYVATTLTTGVPFQANTAYKYRVRAICSTNNITNYSNWSASITFTTNDVGDTCAQPVIVSQLPFVSINQVSTGEYVFDNPGTDCGPGSTIYNNTLSKIYSYTPTSNTNINIMVSPENNEAGVFVYDDCSDIGVNCLAGIATPIPLNKTISNFAVTSGNTYYIVVSTGGDVEYDIVITETCSNPISAQFNIVSDCLSGSGFTAIADVTNMGGATSIEGIAHKADGTTSPLQVINSPGQISFGPYNEDDIVKIELRNQQNNNCILLSGALSKDFCPPANDECSNAITLFDVTEVGYTNLIAEGRLTGATPSSQPSTCLGVEDDDVWYQFTAVNTKHIINIFDINGNDINLNHAVYTGSCGALDLLYCSNNNYSLLENLIVGQVYKIRVFSAGATPVQTSFSISTTSFGPNCMDYNPQSQVVKDLFVNLLNHLIDVSGSVSSTTPYFCPEVAALAPYITDEDPKIYNFDNAPFSFSFSDHDLNDDDFYSPYEFDTPIAEISFFTFPDATGTSKIQITYTDGSYTIKSCTVKHINFCPDTPCTPLVGSIDINPGMSCVTVGSPSGFSFQNNSSNIVSYSWTFFDSNNNIVGSSSLETPVMTFATTGSYTAKVIVITSDGCGTVVQKPFTVSASCPDFCTEVDAQSATVKQLYLNLINYLIENYTSPGQTIPATINCPQLADLAPYITDFSPLIYNLTYSNGILQFAFSNQPGTYHVSVPVNGYINDINLLPFTSASVGLNYETSYLNGTVSNTHFISHVKFCPNTPPDNPDGTPECSPITGNILLDSGVSCIPAGTQPMFSLQSTASNITGLSWTFFAADGVTPLSSSNAEHPSISYSTAGEYKVQVEVTYGTNCTSMITEYFTVVANTADCAGCTETNQESTVVKQLYLNLINHLISFYITGNTLPSNPYTCTQLTALAPYIELDNPKIYNASFDLATGILSFSFSNSGSVSHVSVPATQYISNINIMSYVNSLTAATFPTYFVNNSASSILHSVKYVDFCPAECNNNINGTIQLQSGMSCVALNQAETFVLNGIVPVNSTYVWRFYNSTGNQFVEKYEAEPTFTYNSNGYYQVELTVTDVSGCTSSFYKTIIVSESCDTACTEINPLSGQIKYNYIVLLNKLLNIYEAGQTVDPEDINVELAILAPFITDPEPGVYNINYSNNILSFSFSQSESQPDVVIANHGTVVDINIFNYSSPSVQVNAVVTYNTGIQYTQHTIKHIDFCPASAAPGPCESHVAFVIDESGSISDTDAVDIRKHLREFVDQQENSNMTVSFIGMSDSDANSRYDHVFGKITPENRYMFDNWINKYKSGYLPARTGVSPNSDYWASGLQYAINLTPKPEIIVVITDGSQSSDPTQLKTLVSSIVNDQSATPTHLYVFGDKNGYYVDGTNSTYNANDPGSTPNSSINVTNRLTTSLKYLLGLPAQDFPISSNDNITAATYYDNYDDFDFLYENQTYFSDQFAINDIGCGGEAADICNDCQTFQPSPNQVYWISAWVKEEQNIQVKTYSNAILKVVYEDGAEQFISENEFEAQGDIIDGWQRIASKFTIPENTEYVRIELHNLSPNIPVYFDDIRVHPINGSMKSFVYDPETFRLMAEQDDNNYSTFYEYDKEGGLIRIKKETAKGIQTIQESRSGNVIKPITD